MNISFNHTVRIPNFRKNPIANIIFGIVFIAIVVLFIVLYVTGSPVEQIEDTNGADNFTLQTISDSDIINLNISNTGLKTSSNSITKNYTCSSDCFSGVEALETKLYSGIGDTITIAELQVKSGNIKLAVVENGKIVHEFEPNKENQSFTASGSQGFYELVLAGESTDFELKYSIK